MKSFEEVIQWSANAFQNPPDLQQAWRSSCPTVFFNSFYSYARDTKSNSIKNDLFFIYNFPRHITSTNWKKNSQYLYGFLLSYVQA